MKCDNCDAQIQDTNDLQCPACHQRYCENCWSEYGVCKPCKNQQRVNAAKQALSAYPGCDHSMDGISDLMADLMHMAQDAGVDPEDVLRIATMHYEEEKTPAKKQGDAQEYVIVVRKQEPEEPASENVFWSHIRGLFSSIRMATRYSSMEAAQPTLEWLKRECPHFSVYAQKHEATATGESIRATR